MVFVELFVACLWTPFILGLEQAGHWLRRKKTATEWAQFVLLTFIIWIGDAL